MSHLVVHIPPSEGPIEVGESVVDPLLNFCRELGAGVVVQPAGHLGAWVMWHDLDF